MKLTHAHIRKSLRALALGVSASFPALGGALAGQTNVAVAANYTEVAKETGALFEKATGHKAVFSFGSTGQLYAQITQGAPFDVFLSADQKTPQKAAQEGHALPATLFTYATGKLVLYSNAPALIKDESVLKTARFAKIAIANPATAPYGAAAIETMKALGAYDALKGKIVQGANIAQTYQFVETGNAELGFVALSQVALHKRGSRWIVPERLYATIAQDAVLLKKGEGNEAARAFLAFLKGPQAQNVARKFGYGVAK